MLQKQRHSDSEDAIRDKASNTMKGKSYVAMDHVQGVEILKNEEKLSYMLHL